MNILSNNTIMMKNIRIHAKLLYIIALIVIIPITKAEQFKGDPIRKANAVSAQKAATCLPATSSSELNVNNVRAYIETSGSMWFKEIARYVVPKSGSASSMFAAALWIGGLDVTGQLKLAAIRFRQQGDDFWPGPLNLQGADIDQATCSYYDKHFIMEKKTALEHKNKWADADYVMPNSVRDWPAHPYNYKGDNTGPSYYLAPFFDADGDGTYTPEGGDYPYYDFDNELCPWTDENRARAARGELPQTFESKNNISTGGIMSDQVLKGDQTLWWVFNDKGSAHTETKGSPIGLEIRGQAFAFATNDELNNMTFYSYEIINRSSFELTETYFSQWVDPDLGYAKDDYIGCDVQRGLGYCYNGTNVDGTGLVTHYGENPPAVGVDFFQGPYLDPDGYDNPSFQGDGIFGPSMFGSCEIVTGAENLRQFTWDKTGEGDDTTAYVLVKAEAINGVNFGDGIVDNERFGMRRFVYHNNESGVTGDPSKAWEYYNMLKGIWKDNTKMRYGKNGHKSQATGPECDFMFPGNTDPCNWGTSGVIPNVSNWTDREVNTPEDRRFMQSAGPFTLKKGAINYITVGIPWARATGSPWASVELLRIVDDKCQTLFESCFKVIDGPDAPDLVFREMDNQIICYITNTQGSSNYKDVPEDYMELDYSIPAYRIKQVINTSIDSMNIIICDTIYPDPLDSSVFTLNCRDSLIFITTAVTSNDTVYYDRYYRFEGYQIFQLANETVTADQVNDITKAVLVYQCDLKNGISQIINYEYNAAVATEVPTEKVDGADEGISHSVILTADQFSSGSPLVNYKKYYYLAIAYAHNEYATYITNSDNPDGLFGQKTPYLAGNKNIRVYTVIPHKNVMEENGTEVQASYGMQPPITQFEGQGNGGNSLHLKQETINQILTNGKADSLQFEANGGPITVKVVDPLKVQGYDYILKFYNPNGGTEVTDSTHWMLIYTDENNKVDTIFSETSIAVNNEQLLLDLGLSINITNNKFASLDKEFLLETDANYRLLSTVSYLSSSLTFKDSSKQWLRGVPDVDGGTPLNWIRSGKTKDGDYFMRNVDGYSWDHSNARLEDFYTPISSGDERLKPNTQISNGLYCWYDGDENFEKMVNRTWAPYPMASPYDDGPQFGFEEIENPMWVPIETANTLRIGQAQHIVSMTHLYSVDIVYTSDKTKWTRCPVVEACGDKVLTVGNAVRQNLRRSPSIDKNGIPYGSPGCNTAEASLISTQGMGWFPGYAICVETGERLNMMYAEDSWLSKENGSDMIFNPSPNVYNSAGQYVFGGKHYVYVFGHQDIYTASGANAVISSAAFTSPAYDQGKWAFDLLTQSENQTNSTLRIRDKAVLYKNIMWTSIPLAHPNFKWLDNDATIKLRVSRPYQRWSSSTGVGVTNPVNNNLPWYKFSTKSMETLRNVVDSVISAMDLINVVPNPYYARSSYEADQLDTRIKIINLPQACEIRIYTLNGVLIRTLKKDNTETYVEWDLKNEADIPIAGGVYLIHITDLKTKLTKTLKWFGIQRPTDVNAF
ncbi:MAG: hypothetical protein KBA86_06430 [Bacteroidales bacterium]|nr:hypothetical protein [Bacteroidales bacterium]